MGESDIEFPVREDQVKEIRFVVTPPEHLDVYVLLEQTNGSTPMAMGWHHKRFPSAVDLVGLLQCIRNGIEGKYGDDPGVWPVESPPV